MNRARTPWRRWRYEYRLWVSFGRGWRAREQAPVTGLLTPQENFERTHDLTCPRHPKNAPVPPAFVCPYCRWPEEDIVPFRLYA